MRKLYKVSRYVWEKLFMKEKWREINNPDASIAIQSQTNYWLSIHAHLHSDIWLQIHCNLQMIIVAFIG